MTAIRSEIRDEVFGSDPDTGVLTLLRRGGVRPVLRLSVIAVWTSGLLVVLLLGLWATAPAPRWRLRWRNAIVRRWARGLGWIAGMRVRRVGRPPEAPFFLVANHLSYVDIILLLGEVDGVFVAKHELAAWPALGYLTRLVGTIFVDRARQRDAMRVIGEIDRRIGQGDGVIVFPEGTSSGGDDVFPMRAALFEWAASARHPVHLATLGYATRPGQPPARDAVCWWGSMSFLPHVIGLCRMPGFDATVHFGHPPIAGEDRTDLAARAREAIRTSFVPHEEGPGGVR